MEKENEELRAKVRLKVNVKGRDYGMAARPTETGANMRETSTRI